MSSNQFSRCCNPFNTCVSVKKSDLRILPQHLSWKIPSLSANSKICSRCRRELSTWTPPAHHEGPRAEDHDLPLNDEDNLEADNNFFHPISDLNALLALLKIQTLNNTPARQRTAAFFAGLRTQVDAAIDSMFVSAFSSSGSSEDKSSTQVLERLKKAFSECTTQSERIRILTVAPPSWSARKTATEFGATRHQASTAKALAVEKGVLSTPNPKFGRPLSDVTKKLIVNFYTDDANSRMMPGKKDFVSVKQADGKRIHEQKRLVLCNLSELHSLFLEEHPNTPVSLTKFCELRPKNCVLAGASGTHSVCVCVQHQNAVSMFDASRIAHFTDGADDAIRNIEDCLSKIMCSPPTTSCHLGECKDCPPLETLSETISSTLDDKGVDQVQFSAWVSKPRCTLEVFKKDVEDFVEDFVKQIKSLKTHDFISKEQSKYLFSLKKKLHPGEMLVLCDFAENYAFVAQNAAQSFHWNNDQATIHPAVIYYRTEEGEELQHKSSAIVSDNLCHDTAAFFQYQKIILNFIFSFTDPKKIIYYTDGGPNHYKTRFNFINLCHHQEDFGLPAEFQFHATSHGKTGVDGVGGNYKRLAARASLQLPADQQILSPLALFNWGKAHLKGTTVVFASREEYDAVKAGLQERVRNTTTIQGTHDFHSFIPIGPAKLSARRFSNADKNVVVTPLKTPKKRQSK